MKKEKGTMKQLFKKMAVIFLMGAIAFSVIPTTVQAAGWKQNKNGYWWQENDYSYPKNQWKTIYGKQYHFNSDGYMDTGWKKIDGKWYYLGSKNDGAKKTYWQKVYGKYYWLGRDGVMRTGWQQVYGKYYWLGHSNDGAMKTGWQKVYGKYYWLGHSNDGAMKTGWQTVYGKKYYLGGANDGAMKTGWQQIDGYWYYFGGADDGSLKTNTWIGNYYVDGNGRWNPSKKIELEPYLNDFEKMVSAINGEYFSQTGGVFSKYALGDGIQCGQCENCTRVAYLLTHSLKYSICGVYIGQSMTESNRVLIQKGWKLKEKKYFDFGGRTVYMYTKDDMYLDIETSVKFKPEIMFSIYDGNKNKIMESQDLGSEEKQSAVQEIIPDNTQQEEEMSQDSSEVIEKPETEEQETLEEIQPETNIAEDRREIDSSDLQPEKIEQQEIEQESEVEK